MPESEGGFKEFLLGDLFVASNGDTDIQATHINGIGIPVVSSGTKNNGIIGLSDVKAKVFESGTITIDMFGNCFYQKDKYKMVTHARVFSLSPLNFQLNDKRGLYLVAQFSFVSKLFSYGNMASWQKIKGYNLSLPVLTNGEINWFYIESFVDEIIKSRENKLNEFFEANGYSDCTLTADERQARDLFMTRSHKMKEILLNRVFTLKGVKQSKCQSEIPSVAYGIPYVVQSMNNNMCSRNVERQWLIDNNEPPQEGNTIVLGVTLPAISYQPLEFGASQVITARNPNLNESVGLYFAAVLRKHMAKFSYQNKPGIQKYKELYLCLPVTNDGSIDYDFMECYVNALKKQCIARLKASDMFSHDGINSMQIDLSKKDKSKINHKTTIVSNSDCKSTNNDSHVIKGSTLSYKDIVEPQQTMAAEDGC